MVARPFKAGTTLVVLPACGIASALRVYAIFRVGRVTESRQGKTRRADAQPLAGSVFASYTVRGVW